MTGSSVPDGRNIGERDPAPSDLEEFGIVIFETIRGRTLLREIFQMEPDEAQIATTELRLEMVDVRIEALGDDQRDGHDRGSTEAVQRWRDGTRSNEIRPANPGSNAATPKLSSSHVVPYRFRARQAH